MTLVTFWQYKLFRDIRRRFLQERLQTGLGSLKSTYLQFSLCYYYRKFRNNVGINCTLRRHAFWISAGANKDDLECPIQLYVRFTDGTLDVRIML